MKGVIRLPIEAIQGKVRSEPLNRNFSYMDSKVDRFNDKLNQKGVNVKLFGAVGDGASDDTDSILEALAFANSNGFDLDLSNGAYGVRMGTEWDCDNVRIRGIGNAEVITLPGEVTDKFITIKGKGNVIQGITFREGEVPAKIFLEVVNDGNVIDFCKVFNNDRYVTDSIPYSDQAINIIGNKNVVRNSEVYNCGLGVNVRNFDNKIIGCFVHDNVCGIRLSASCRNVEVGGNIIEKNNVNSESGADGILGHRNVSNMWIHHNKIHDNGEHGMYFQGDNSIIESNIVFGNARSGIKLASYTTGLSWHPGESEDINYVGHNNIIRGNICNKNGQEDSSNSGIYLQSPLRDILISNNIVDGNLTGYGIRAVFLGEGDTLEGLSFFQNHCQNHAISDITAAGHHNIKVIGNDVSGRISTYSDSTQNNEDALIAENIAHTIEIIRSDKTLVLDNVSSVMLVSNNCSLIQLRGNRILKQDQNLNLRRVLEFSDNEIHLVGDIKLYNDAGSLQLRKFVNNEILAPDASSHYVFNPIFGAKTNHLRMIGNRFEIPDTVRTFCVWGEKLTIGHNLTTSTEGWSYDLYTTDSTIVGNHGGVHFRNGATGNVATANIGGYSGETSANTIIG